MFSIILLPDFSYTLKRTDFQAFEFFTICNSIRSANLDVNFKVYDFLKVRFLKININYFWQISLWLTTLDCFQKLQYIFKTRSLPAQNEDIFVQLRRIGQIY